jgi:septal ring factor EnvC (AmiA/AmiB activator)
MRSMEDMLDKFSAQKANKKNLEKEVQEVETRLTEAKKMNARAEQAFQERKSSGVGELENDKSVILSSSLLCVIMILSLSL